jgi:hypothetical protein
MVHFLSRIGSMQALRAQAGEPPNAFRFPAGHTFSGNITFNIAASVGVPFQQIL